MDAAVILAAKLKPGHLPVNVSSGERLLVSRIAELICEGLRVPDAKIEYTGSKRGWAGDVVVTDLDIARLRSFGWEPTISLEDGVQLYIDWLVNNYGSVI